MYNSLFITSGYAPRGLKGHLKRGELNPFLFNLSNVYVAFKSLQKYEYIFLKIVISLGRVVVLSPIIVINLP
jgi:hypothetical protein